MSPRIAINSEKGLRSPLFSQAIVCNGMVYVSGNIGMDYAKMELIEGGVADRTVRSNALP
jgi:enamine deaminase RidA (YjgF/YER057c/UK114 family)